MSEILWRVNASSKEKQRRIVEGAKGRGRVLTDEAAGVLVGNRSEYGKATFFRLLKKSPKFLKKDLIALIWWTRHFASLR
jgi:hypothetical protein